MTDSGALTPAQVRAFEELGWLCPLPAVAAGAVPRLLAMFERLRRLLPPGASTQRMDWWHAFDRELYEICCTGAILDRVESLLGPDFYLWGTQFFAKDPGDGKITPGTRMRSTGRSTRSVPSPSGWPSPTATARTAPCR